LASDATDMLAERIRTRDARAVARALSMVENGEEGAAALLHRLFDPSSSWKSIGVTGPPGAGKSTLVDRLITHWRSSGRRVGVIAVDPSSPFSGGALLGDRLRMQDHACDEGVFIRSTGSRGHIGGLADTTSQMAEVLAAAGYDPIIIETVGVGQGEVEIASVADITVLVLVPGLGDEVQVMKAGIMEIGDIIVLNKADRPGMDQLEVAVRSGLDMLPDSSRRPPLVRCSAETGEGVEAVAKEIDDLVTLSLASPGMRRERIRSIILRIAGEKGSRIGLMLLDRMYGREEAVDKVLAGATSPWEIGEELAKQALRALE
jgi:LAO/AO transport system kinase